MIKNRLLMLCLLFFIAPAFARAQSFLEKGSLKGNFKLDAQYYFEDSLIGAPAVPEQMMLNAFAAFTYTNGNFEAGLRYESYLNPLSGIDPRYAGSGFANRYLKYKTDLFEITVGNFYEQFGSGMILRTYEERNLGFDNSLDGIRLKVAPYRGITIKGLIGQQRYFWDKGKGIVRGIDAEIDVNALLARDMKTKIYLGGGMVSKFQKDLDPIYKLPENVAAYSFRANFVRGRFNVSGEYAGKINDPSTVNGLIYKPGHSLLVQGSYSKKGLGIILGLKRIDNMDFRSDRTETGNALLINFLPALTKQHTYSLAAMYPYATQPTGEMAAQGGIIYTLKRGSKLGGKYGTTININYSIAHAIDRQVPDDTAAVGTAGTLGYTSDFFAVGERKYFQDFGIDVTRKLSKKLKVVLTYLNQQYDIETIEGHPGEEMVYAQIAIADLTWKYKSRKSLRFETQHLWTQQDEGNWALGMVEWTSKHWFLAAMDQYNYGNESAEHRIHYYNFAGGYITGGTRISMGYGKQREGIVCVGGVCRAVPASNGFTLSITSSF